MEELRDFLIKKWEKLVIFSFIIAGILYSIDNFIGEQYISIFKNIFTIIAILIIILIIAFSKDILKKVSLLKNSCYFLFPLFFGVVLYVVFLNFWVLLIAIVASLFFILWDPLNKMKRSKNNELGITDSSNIDDGPINNIENDRFERREFIENFGKLLIKNKKDSVVYGINGSWGSGKTSFVLMTLNNSNQELIWIHFESWHYRHTNKIIEKLFNKISDRLIESIPDKKRKIKDELKSLANYITSVELYGLKFNISEFLNGNNKSNIVEILNNDLKSHLVVFIDDLDRLDNDELVAVFRAIRIIGKLPKIQFILAYDKKIIGALLYPNDEKGALGKDFLKKIVQYEFTLAVPSENIRKNFLNSIMESSDLQFDSDQKNEFTEFIQYEQVSFHLFRLLPTPRDIKRILYQTLWIYTTTAKNNEFRYNFTDLFILTTLQYQDPILYEKLYTESATIIEFLRDAFGLPLESHPAFMNNYETSQGPNIRVCISKEKILEKIGRNVFLEYILPPLYENCGDLTTSLKKKRFFCPVLYESYFQYTSSDELEKLNEILCETSKVSDLSSAIGCLSNLLEDINIHNLLSRNHYWNVFLKLLIEKK